MCVCVCVCVRVLSPSNLIIKVDIGKHCSSSTVSSPLQSRIVLIVLILFVVLLYLGVPTVNDVSASGLNVTCASSGGPATSVTWRRNCAVLPNNAMYQQTQTVIQTPTATYQNTLVIDSTVTDTDGVYTCSVTNTRGYSNGVIGMGGKPYIHIYALLKI
jgi:hypothetical protein